MVERRSYTKEYKKSIVEQILKSHKSTKVVAVDSGIPVKTLEKWFTAYRKDKYVFDRENLSVIAENKKLQKLNKKLLKDIEILNKAIQISAKNKVSLYEIVMHLRKDYPVSSVCRLFNISLSSYNHWFQKYIKRNKFNVNFTHLDKNCRKMGGGKKINKIKINYKDKIKTVYII